MTKKEPFKADNMWVLAIDMIDRLEKSEDTRKRNVEELFWYEIEKRVEKGESININLNGDVRSGKSTIGQMICERIKKMIEKYHKVKRPMSNANILRDQNEYARTVKRRPESFKHECDVIDEWAEMELTGYNATIEEKFLKQFSDVQAGRYYHRIACSPSNITDENCNIILHTIPGSREDGRTSCLMSYRVKNGDTSQPVLLGHIIFDVRKTLKAKWYKEYLKKKEEKWELMNKYNIKSPRELEYAQIILNTFGRIKELAKCGLTRKKYFKTVLSEEADKRSVWFSILGDKDVLETLEGMADQVEVITRLEGKVRKMPALSNTLKEIKKSLAETLRILTNKSNLWDKYQLIES